MDESTREELPIGLWKADQGELELTTRRVLARLVAGPYIDADDQRDLWSVLIEQERVVRSRLNDMCLELVMDSEAGLAFARNITADSSQKIPKVMRTDTLTHLATMLLMRVRQLQLQASARGEVAYTDFDEIREFLRPYISADGVQDDMTINKRVSGAISSVKRYSILTDHGDRMRISSIVSLIVTPETMDRYLSQYQAIIDGVPLASLDSGDVDE